MCVSAEDIHCRVHTVPVKDKPDLFRLNKWIWLDVDTLRVHTK